MTLPPPLHRSEVADRHWQAVSALSAPSPQTARWPHARRRLGRLLIAAGRHLTAGAPEVLPTEPCC